MTIRDVFIRRGIPWRMQPRDHIAICCVFCPENGETPDSKFRLSINMVTGAAYCFNCLWKSRNAFKAILRNLKMEVHLEGEVPEIEEQEIPQLPDDFQLLTRASSDLDKIAIRYLRSRGITPEQVVAKRIGISLIGRFAYRIIFPVRDGKQLKGIVARDFTNQQEPRYLNSIGDKGLYNCNCAPVKTAILSEGVFKALRIERLNTGFASMALLGRDITDFQIEQLRKRECREVILWPDPDRPGRQGAVKIGQKLQENGLLVGVVWPVYQAADEEPLDSMENTWKNVEGFTWGTQQKLALGAR